MESSPGMTAKEVQTRMARLDELHASRDAGRHASLLLHWARTWLWPMRRAVIEPLPTPQLGEVGITFGGHASVMVRYADVGCVCDPMLGTRLGMARREVQPGLTPKQLSDADLILLSHGHGDHLHRGTLKQLSKSATVIVPAGSAGLISKLGFSRVVELAHGASQMHRGMEVTAVPVAHDMRGDRIASAYVIKGNGPTVLFCGDSAYFPGFSEMGREHRPDIALLPIAGYLPTSFRERHMSPLDAICAFEDLRARMLIPIHYGAFTLSYEPEGEPLSWLRRLVGKHHLETHVTIMPAGASRKFTR